MKVMGKAAAVTTLSLAVASPGLAAPAVAGGDWERPQPITAEYGRDVDLSRNGRVAVWIRTNRTDPGATGRVRAAWYLKKKQKWSRAKAIPGARKASDIQLSRKGDHAFLALPGSYAVATRTARNTWDAPQQVAEGEVTAGFMSENGDTVGWLADGTVLQVRTRLSDGSFGPVTALGTFAYSPSGTVFSPVSGDGATAVRLEESALVAHTLNPDGTWSQPQTLREFDPAFGFAMGTKSLQVSYKGDLVLVSNPELSTITMARVDGTWEFRRNRVFSPASVDLSPSGDVIAWTSIHRPGLRVAQWLGAKWGSTTVDKTAVDPQVALANTAMAWTRSGPGPSTLWTSTLYRGKFTKGERLAAKAADPAISSDGRTVAWSDTRRGRLMSAKR